MVEIINAEYINSYLINITFTDGVMGVVDFSNYTKYNGLFKALESIDFFKDFSVDKDLGTIVWKNGLDISPETLYYKVTGKLAKGLYL